MRPVAVYPCFKATLVLFLLCWFSIASAQEVRWLCGAEQTGGFARQGGDWRLVPFLPDNASFTLNEDKGAVEFSETIYVLDCEQRGAHLYCHNDTQNFVLDLETERAGFSSLQGALIQSNVFISLFQCTKL